MELEEIISLLGKTKYELEKLDTTLKDTNEEITIWRQIFLSSLPKYESLEKAAFIWNYFLAAPSSNIVNQTPEKIIKSYEIYYDETKK